MLFPQRFLLRHGKLRDALLHESPVGHSHSVVLAWKGFSVIKKTKTHSSADQPGTTLIDRKYFFVGDCQSSFIGPHCVESSLTRMAGSGDCPHPWFNALVSLQLLLRVWLDFLPSFIEIRLIGSSLPRLRFSVQPSSPMIPASLMRSSCPSSINLVIDD